MLDNETSKWAVNQWAMVALVGMCFVIVGAFVWWIEKNFGALVAVMCLGLLAGAGFFMAGGAFQQRSAKLTMENMVDSLHELAGPQKEIWKVVNQNARLDLAQFNHQARLQQMDERVINDLANKRAKAVVDAERYKWSIEQERQDQQAKAWDITEDTETEESDWSQF